MSAHVWERDAQGQPVYHEPIDGHGGPRCILCDYWYCSACSDEPPEPECEAQVVEQVPTACALPIAAAEKEGPQG